MLKTLFDYWGGRKDSLSALIRDGVRRDAYSARRGGWIHAGLVELARSRGFSARAADYASLSFERAFSALRRDLKKGPLIVSVRKDFRPAAGGHLIVLFAVRGNRIFYNEPASRTRRGIRRSAGQKTFAQGWKQRYIVVRPAKRIPKR